jgi:hypothetical protein
MIGSEIYFNSEGVNNPPLIKALLFGTAAPQVTRTINDVTRAPATGDGKYCYHRT